MKSWRHAKTQAPQGTPTPRGPPTTQNFGLNVASLVAAVFSVALAIISIWLSLHHKGQADEVHKKTISLLEQVRSDTQTVKDHAFQQLEKITNKMSDSLFQQEPSAAQSGPKPEETGEPQEERRVENQLSPSLTTAGAETPALSSLSEFREVVQRMAQGSMISSQDRDLGVSLVGAIADVGDHDAPEFLLLLEQFMDFLMATSQNTHLDFVDDLLSDVTTRQQGINTTVLQSLGLRMLGSETTARQRELERFKKHMAAAANHANQPLADFIWLAYSFLQGDTHEVAETFDRVEALGSSATLAFIGTMDYFCEESRIADQATDKVVAIAENCRRFRSAHEGRLDALRSRIVPD